MATRKKTPMRMCVGCREMKPKKELVRVVRSKEGELSIDLRGKAPGRGAYVCTDTECLERVIRSRAIERALEAKAEPKLFDELRLMLSQRAANEQ